MLKKIREFTRLYLTMLLHNKMAVFWILVFPTLLMMLNKKDALFAEHASIQTRHAVQYYWSYMILITAMTGVAIQLMVSRDNGFLKQFTYVAGSKYPIVIGSMLSQLIFLIGNIVLFTSACSFAFRLPFFPFVGSALLLALFCLVPVCCCLLWLPVMPVRQESLVPVLNLIIIPLIYIADAHSTSGKAWEIVYFLNPVEFIVCSSRLFIQAGDALDATQMAGIIVSFVAYTAIGLFFIRKIPLYSLSGRA